MKISIPQEVRDAVAEYMDLLKQTNYCATNQIDYNIRQLEDIITPEHELYSPLKALRNMFELSQKVVKDKIPAVAARIKALVTVQCLESLVSTMALQYSTCYSETGVMWPHYLEVEESSIYVVGRAAYVHKIGDDRNEFVVDSKRTLTLANLSDWKKKAPKQFENFQIIRADDAVKIVKEYMSRTDIVNITNL